MSKRACDIQRQTRAQLGPLSQFVALKLSGNLALRILTEISNSRGFSTQCTRSKEWPLNLCSKRKVASVGKSCRPGMSLGPTWHNCAVPSSEVVRMRRPSGSNLAERIPSHSSTASDFPSRSQRRRMSSVAVVTIRPHGPSLRRSSSRLARRGTIVLKAHQPLGRVLDNGLRPGRTLPLWRNHELVPTGWNLKTYGQAM